MDGQRLSVENEPPGTRSKSEPPTPPLKVDYPSLGRPPPLEYSDFERRFQRKFMVGNFEYPYYQSFSYAVKVFLAFSYIVLSL